MVTWHNCFFNFLGMVNEIIEHGRLGLGVASSNRNGVGFNGWDCMIYLFGEGDRISSHISTPASIAIVFGTHP